MKSSIRFLFLSTMLSLMNVQAETYYWNVSSGTWGEYGNVANWLINDANGVAAETLPDSGDKLYDYAKDSGTRTFYMDMGGGDYSLGGWSDTAGWNRTSLVISNGTLRFTESVPLHGTPSSSNRDRILNGGTLVFAPGTTYTPGLNDGASRYMNVENGGTLNMTDAGLTIYKLNLQIFAGGVAELGCRAIAIHGGSAQESEIVNEGTLNFSKGCVLSGGSTKGSVKIKQLAGTMNLGGDISLNGKPGTVNVELSGGTVKAVKDVAFNVTSAKLTKNAEISFDVADNKLLDLSTVVCESGVRLTKTGAGALSINASLTGAVSVTEGSLRLCEENAIYDLSAFTLADGTKLMLGASGITLAAAPVGNYSFVLDLDAIFTGSVFLISDDPALLAKAKADIETALPPILMIAESGNTLSLKTVCIFDSTSISDLNDPMGWSCGFVPTNEAVQIKGSGVTARVTGDIARFASIQLVDDAALFVDAAVELPKIILAYNASLTIGTSVIMTNGIVGIASDEAIPTLTIPAGVTLTVPAYSKFKNLNVVLNGTLTGKTVGPIFLGYASEGETSYFGLVSESGTLKTVTGGNYQTADLYLCSPAAGGTVIVPDPIVFKSTTFNIGYLSAFKFGQNNPTNQPITVIFDSVSHNLTGPSVFGGAMELILTNASTLSTDQGNSHWSPVTFTDRFKLTINEGSLVRFPAVDGNHAFEPTEDNWPMLVLNGGKYACFRTSGNGKARLVCKGGVLENYTGAVGDRVNRPFGGLKCVEIETDKTLVYNAAGNVGKHLIAGNTPITGGGSLLFTNSVPTAVFEVVLSNGVSTATGTLSAVGGAKVYFADGANWAGTVVAGDVALTNLDHAAACATCSFGGLDLSADFPMLISASANDRLVMGDRGFSGSGKLVFTGVDGYDYAAGAPLTVGSVMKSAAAVPRTSAHGFHLRLMADETDPLRQNLVLGTSGVIIIIK